MTAPITVFASKGQARDVRERWVRPACRRAFTAQRAVLIASRGG